MSRRLRELHEMFSPTVGALQQAVDCIRRLGPDSPSDLLCLGCGDARKEVLLYQQLREHQRALRLLLLDLSPPLLGAALHHAADALPGSPIFAVQGDFCHLPQYVQYLLPAQSERPALVCMLGSTFGSLVNEALFIRSALAAMEPGTLLLLELGLACAAIDQPEDVVRADPLLSGQAPAPWLRAYTAWLTNLVRRYNPRATEVKLHLGLDTTACVINGSYAVETRVHIRYPDEGMPRLLSLLRDKRYELTELRHALRTLGWESLGFWPTANQTALLLLRRG